MDHADAPPGWQRAWSRTYKRHYYYHAASKTVCWDFPSAKVIQEAIESIGGRLSHEPPKPPKPSNPAGSGKRAQSVVEMMLRAPPASNAGMRGKSHSGVRSSGGGESTAGSMGMPRLSRTSDMEGNRFSAGSVLLQDLAAAEGVHPSGYDRSSVESSAFRQGLLKGSPANSGPKLELPVRGGHSPVRSSDSTASDVSPQKFNSRFSDVDSRDSSASPQKVKNKGISDPSVYQGEQFGAQMSASTAPPGSSSTTSGGVPPTNPRHNVKSTSRTSTLSGEEPYYVQFDSGSNFQLDSTTVVKPGATPEGGPARPPTSNGSLPRHRQDLHDKIEDLEKSVDRLDKAESDSGGLVGYGNQSSFAERTPHIEKHERRNSTEDDRLGVTLQEWSIKDIVARVTSSPVSPEHARHSSGTTSAEYNGSGPQNRGATHQAHDQPADPRDGPGGTERPNIVADRFNNNEPEGPGIDGAEKRVQTSVEHRNKSSAEERPTNPETQAGYSAVEQRIKAFFENLEESSAPPQAEKVERASIPTDVLMADLDQTFCVPPQASKDNEKRPSLCVVHESASPERPRSKPTCADANGFSAEQRQRFDQRRSSGDVNVEPLQDVGSPPPAHPSKPLPSVGGEEQNDESQVVSVHSFGADDDAAQLPVPSAAHNRSQFGDAGGKEDSASEPMTLAAPQHARMDPSSPVREYRDPDGGREFQPTSAVEAQVSRPAEVQPLPQVEAQEFAGPADNGVSTSADSVMSVIQEPEDHVQHLPTSPAQDLEATAICDVPAGATTEVETSREEDAVGGIRTVAAFEQPVVLPSVPEETMELSVDSQPPQVPQDGRDQAPEVDCVKDRWSIPEIHVGPWETEQQVGDESAAPSRISSNNSTGEVEQPIASASKSTEQPPAQSPRSTEQPLFAVPSNTDSSVAVPASIVGRSPSPPARGIVQRSVSPADVARECESAPSHLAPGGFVPSSPDFVPRPPLAVGIHTDAQPATREASNLGTSPVEMGCTETVPAMHHSPSLEANVYFVEPSSPDPITAHPANSEHVAESPVGASIGDRVKAMPAPAESSYGVRVVTPSGILRTFAPSATGGTGEVLHESVTRPAPIEVQRAAEPAKQPGQKAVVEMGGVSSLAVPVARVSSDGISASDGYFSENSDNLTPPAPEVFVVEPVTLSGRAPYPGHSTVADMGGASLPSVPAPRLSLETSSASDGDVGECFANLTPPVPDVFVVDPVTLSGRVQEAPSASNSGFSLPPTPDWSHADRIADQPSSVPQQMRAANLDDTRPCGAEEQASCSSFPKTRSRTAVSPPPAVPRLNLEDTVPRQNSEDSSNPSVWGGSVASDGRLAQSSLMLPGTGNSTPRSLPGKSLHDPAFKHQVRRPQRRGVAVSPSTRAFSQRPLHLSRGEKVAVRSPPSSVGSSISPKRRGRPYTTEGFSSQAHRACSPASTEETKPAFVFSNGERPSNGIDILFMTRPRQADTFCPTQTQTPSDVSPGISNGGNDIEAQGPLASASVDSIRGSRLLDATVDCCPRQPSSIVTEVGGGGTKMEASAMPTTIVTTSYSDVPENPKVHVELPVIAEDTDGVTSSRAAQGLKPAQDSEAAYDRNEAFEDRVVYCEERGTQTDYVVMASPRRYDDDLNAEMQELMQELKAKQEKAKAKTQAPVQDAKAAALSSRAQELEAAIEHERSRKEMLRAQLLVEQRGAQGLQKQTETMETELQSKTASLQLAQHVLQDHEDRLQNMAAKVDTLLRVKPDSKAAQMIKLQLQIAKLDSQLESRCARAVALETEIKLKKQEKAMFG